MNLFGGLGRGDRGNHQTSVDNFVNHAVETKEAQFEHFFKQIKYTDGVRNRWSINEAKTTFDKLLQVFQGDVGVVPALVTCLGSVHSKIQENSTSNDDIQWYLAKSRALLEKSGIHPRAVENCYAAYADMVHGLTKLVESALNSAQQLEYVGLFKRAIVVLQNGKSGRLTAAHAPFVCICVENRLYHIIDSLVCTVICECSPNLHPLDFLYYFYYAGMTHVALKRFHQALDHFAMCQIVPGEASSMIQIDAHKKYILVSLIVSGRVAPLPEFVSHRLQKTHNKCCRPYFELNEAFSESMANMERVVQRHYDTFEKDYNVGLVQQVLKAQEISRVRRLRNVYASCSVETAARQAQISNPERAKKIILHLIKEGELSAKVDANNIVTFTKNKGEIERRYQAYARQIAAVMDLSKQAEAMFYTLRTSEKYIKSTSALSSERAAELIDQDVSLMS